jgi:short-subunit dehydrogenase
MKHPAVIILTGATQGIGRAIAFALAQAGHHLLLNARSQDDLVALKTTLLEKHPSLKIEMIAGSISKPATCESLVTHAVSVWGCLDVLINNAGVGAAFALLQETSIEEIDAMIDVNLKGPVYLMKYAIPVMVEKGSGLIINMNSIAGKQPYALSSVYCASKYALHGLTECAALEQRVNGIRIMGIYPGEVHTPMWETLLPEQSMDANKMLAAEDIARAVCYALESASGNAYLKELTILPLHTADHT